MSLRGNDALPPDRQTSPLIVSLLSPGGEYAWTSLSKVALTLRFSIFLAGGT